MNDMDLPKNYFRKERIVLKALGVSLSGNESIAYKIYSFLSLFILNYSYPILAFGDVFKHDFEVVLNILLYEFIVFVGTAKTTTVLRNRIKLGEILDKLEKEPFLPNPERGGNVEIKVIKRCLRITNTQAILYWSVSIISITVGVIYTLRQRIRSSNYEDWKFLFGSFTFFNATHSPNYEISWVYQIVSVTCIGYHFCTIDLITAAVLAHLSTQFKILQNNISRILSIAYKEMLKDTDMKIIESNYNLRKSIDGSQIPYKYLKRALEQAVRYHLAIIEVVNEVEELFSGLLLLVFVGALGMLGLSVYYSSLIPYNDVQFLQRITEVICICVQVVILCFWGEQLIFESEMVGRAAYESNFVGTDLRFPKGIALIIRRSQYPTNITAGKYADICLSTLTWILRTSWSAFMILRGRQIEK